MAIIRGNVDVVRMKEGDASPMARHYRAIQSQVDRMGELAQDILEFSKGRTRLERVDVPLQSYFEEIVDGQRASFEESHVRLVLAPSPPVTACIDPARFRRVVDNLLVNARQALGTGGCVTVGWRTENDLLLVNVEDDGPGIPESIRDSLFDPFVTSGKAQGTGLGLAITQKVVEDHGGRIGVETDPSWGTRFTITLPLTATAGVPREESPA